MSSKLEYFDLCLCNGEITGQPNVWSGLISKLVNIVVYGGLLYATYIFFSIRITSSQVIESDVGKFLQLSEKSCHVSLYTVIYMTSDSIPRMFCVAKWLYWGFANGYVCLNLPVGAVLVLTMFYSCNGVCGNQGVAVMF